MTLRQWLQTTLLPFLALIFSSDFLNLGFIHALILSVRSYHCLWLGTSVISQNSFSSSVSREYLFEDGFTGGKAPACFSPHFSLSPESLNAKFNDSYLST
jgi:hypothetical protein